MKQLFLYIKNSLMVTLVIVSVVIVGCENDEGILEVQEIDDIVGYEIEAIEGQYVVVLHGESTLKNSIVDYKTAKGLASKQLISKFSKIKLSDKSIKYAYNYALHGFTASLSGTQLEALKRDNRVKLIEQDYMITLGRPVDKPGKGGSDDEDSPSEVTPWGITRVGGGVVSYVGSGVAWVIDSGIDLDHPDLNVDIARSESFLGGKDRDDPNDANGHGTHVAGTIAAIDNEIGVVGVAPGATVISVRVLNRRGSGSYSGVIAGVDYVGTNGQGGDVANMSLGGGVSTTLDNAVVSAAADGVIFCLAAGNESDDADNHSPARAEGANVYTISASDINDNFASFSNYGSHVDFCAPGVSIESTWKNGGYNTISGTSMAAPHAAGVFLMGENSDSNVTVNGDPDGNPDVIISH